MIQTTSNRTTYQSIEDIGKQHNLPATYLAYLIANLEPYIREQLDLKTLHGHQYLGNLSVRYLVTHADRSAASLFPDVTPEVINDDPVPISTPPMKTTRYSVQRDLTNGYWFLIRDDSGGQTLIGTFGSEDAAHIALDKAMEKV